MNLLFCLLANDTKSWFGHDDDDGDDHQFCVSLFKLMNPSIHNNMLFLCWNRQKRVFHWIKKKKAKATKNETKWNR